MISQKCPKCSSSRVRRGYRPTPIWLKIFCRYHLLCDGCNWEFVGFAVPGTVDSKPTRKKKTQQKSENKAGTFGGDLTENNSVSADPVKAKR